MISVSARLISTRRAVTVLRSPYVTIPSVVPWPTMLNFWYAFWILFLTVHSPRVWALRKVLNEVDLWLIAVLKRFFSSLVHFYYRSDTHVFGNIFIDIETTIHIRSIPNKYFPWKSVISPSKSLFFLCNAVSWTNQPCDNNQVLPIKIFMFKLWTPQLVKFPVFHWSFKRDVKN